METIIAATNFSEEANHAVAFATDVAQQLKARLVIFNDLAFQPVISENPMPMEVYDQCLEETETSLAQLKKEMEIRSDGEIEVETLYETGTTRSRLDKLFACKNHFAVFISSSSIDSFERSVFGTYGMSIVRDSPFPVIVVPPSANMTGFKKIALAIDMHKPGKIPWLFLNNWLNLFTPQLDIVYVSKKAGVSPNHLPVAADIEHQLEDFHPKYHFITNDSVKDGLYEYIEANKPDLLIMLVQKHSFFHKSETKPFIIHPPIPVMMLTTKVKEKVVYTTEEIQDAWD